MVLGFANGQQYGSNWEVAEVQRPLLSVSRCVSRGNYVWFAPEELGGSGIYNYPTGRMMKVWERDGVYVLPAWIADPDSEIQKASFQRQAPL